MKAIFNNTVIAESEETIVVEGNHYFPTSSIKTEYFSSSKTETICPWKGTANYYTIEVNNKINQDAAWFYKTPKSAAIQIKNKVAFWKEVKISE